MGVKVGEGGSMGGSTSPPPPLQGVPSSKGLGWGGARGEAKSCDVRVPPTAPRPTRLYAGGPLRRDFPTPTRGAFGRAGYGYIRRRYSLTPRVQVYGALL